MALADVIPTITSARMLRYLAQSNVWFALTNRMFESELARGGDSITIAPIGTDFVSVGAYDPVATTVTYPQVTVGDKIQLDVNETDYWAFSLDDVYRREAIPNIWDEAMKVAADKAAIEMNKNARAAFFANMAADHQFKVGDNTADDKMLDFTGDLAPAQGDESQFAQAFSRAALYIQYARLPSMGNFAVVGPAVYHHMLREDASFEAVPEAARGRARGEGMIAGMRHGFRIVPDFHFRPPKTDAAGGIDDYWTDNIFFGNDYAVAAVMEISKTERMRLEGKFATGMRGLYHYGLKTIEPKGLFKADVFYRNLDYPAA